MQLTTFTHQYVKQYQNQSIPKRQLTYQSFQGKIFCLCHAVDTFFVLAPSSVEELLLSKYQLILIILCRSPNVPIGLICMLLPQFSWWIYYKCRISGIPAFAVSGCFQVLLLGNLQYHFQYHLRAQVPLSMVSEVLTSLVKATHSSCGPALWECRNLPFGDTGLLKRNSCLQSLLDVSYLICIHSVSLQQLQQLLTWNSHIRTVLYHFFF